MEIRRKRREVIYVIKSLNEKYINQNQLITKSSDHVFQAIELFPECKLEIWCNEELRLQILCGDIPCKTIEEFFRWVRERVEEDNAEDLTMKKIVHIKNGWYKKVLDERNMSL